MVAETVDRRALEQRLVRAEGALEEAQARRDQLRPLVGLGEASPGALKAAERAAKSALDECDVARAALEELRRREAAAAQAEREEREAARRQALHGIFGQAKAAAEDAIVAANDYAEALSELQATQQRLDEAARTHGRGGLVRPWRSTYAGLGVSLPGMLRELKARLRSDIERLAEIEGRL